MKNCFSLRERTIAESSPPCHIRDEKDEGQQEQSHKTQDKTYFSSLSLLVTPWILVMLICRENVPFSRRPATPRFRFQAFLESASLSVLSGLKISSSSFQSELLLRFLPARMGDHLPSRQVLLSLSSAQTNSSSILPSCSQLPERSIAKLSSIYSPTGISRASSALNLIP